MIRINLLPHRAEKRRARQIQFGIFAGVALLAALVVVVVVHLIIDSHISYQERRNEFLRQETAILSRQIGEIKKLKAQTQALLARKTVVEDLQSTRADVVHLFDQMLRILPEGVYLKSLKQTGGKITLVGYAHANARISTLMRSIEDSPWLDTPALIEIHATTANSTRVSEFTLTFNLSKPGTPAPAAEPTKQVKS